MDNIFKFDTKWNENFDTYTKAATESAQAFEKITSQVAEQLTATQKAFWANTLDSTNQLFSIFSTGKDFKDAAAQQIAILTEINQKAVEVAKESGEILANSKSDYQAWAEKGAQTIAAATPMNEVTPARKPTKKAA